MQPEELAPLAPCSISNVSGTKGKNLTILRHLLPLAVLMLAGCGGQQSALEPAGKEAEAVYRLFIVMVIGGAAIWLGVAALFLHAARHRETVWAPAQASALIGWGGVALPVVVLLGLLGYAVWLMPAIRPWTAVPESNGAVEITGEQFWWRVRYPSKDGLPGFETANEIRLPVNRPAAFSLKATDVIHSFWIPSLGGKMDMIPGRTNFLTLVPTRTGIFRSPCAEFCGTSHAYMALSVIVMEDEEFAAWRSRQISGHGETDDHGRDLIQRHGCLGCHSLRGQEIAGQTAPDLTLMGSRQSIGAGSLANSTENIARFIRSPASVKPGAKMPAFDMLPPRDIEDMARYLGGLK